MDNYKKFNLILSGGGVRSYTHLGLYKYFYEHDIEFEEIIGISGGSIVAPFICARKDPNEIIWLLQNAELHKKILPFWYIPDTFEVLFYEPRTYKIGEWVEQQFTKNELEKIHADCKLHILGTRYPTIGSPANVQDMLQITDLKNAIAASSAISGVFKPHIINGQTYIDGAHWNSLPIFYDFNDKTIPLLVSNLGYTGLLENDGGRITKIFKGFEIAGYARLQESIKHWNEDKSCINRGELIVINSRVWDISPLKFDLTEEEINRLISAGYNAAKNKFLELNNTLLV